MLKSNSANKLGISYIEILIMLLILGLITSFVIPSFLRKQGKSVKQRFLADFALLIKDSVTNAMVTEKTHQIFFDIKTRQIIVKIQDFSQQSAGEHNRFTPIQLGSHSEPMIIPQDLEIRNFFINGIDEFASGNTMMWFYIMPDGTSQSVIINIEDTETTSHQNKCAIMINPFYSQVKEYDDFQKP